MTDQTASTYLFVAMIAIALLAVFLVLNGKRRAAEERRREQEYVSAYLRTSTRERALPDPVRPRRHGDYATSRPTQATSRDRAESRSSAAEMDMLHGIYSPGLLDISDGYGRNSAYGGSRLSSEIGRDRDDTGHTSSHGTSSAFSQDSSDSYSRSSGSSYGGGSSYSGGSSSSSSYGSDSGSSYSSDSGGGGGGSD